MPDPFEPCWSAHPLVGALHIAERLRLGHGGRAGWEEPVVVLDGPLAKCWLAMGLSETEAWRRLLLGATRAESKQPGRESASELASGLTSDAGLAQQCSSGLLLWFDALEAARPGWQDSVMHRIRPLREHWEARGPGLLRRLARWIEPPHVPPTIAICPPVVGGFGAALDDSGWLRFEGLLANPVPRVPETVRLAWTIAQVWSNMAGHTLSPTRLLPNVRAAAMHVEWLAADVSLLELWRTWGLPGDGEAAVGSEE